MPVKAARMEPRCKICSHDRRPEIDLILELRSTHGKLPNGKVATLTPVLEILGSDSTSTWVADLGGRAVGFAAARVVDPDRRIGEVHIVGVDPDAQHQGIGTTLVRHAEVWLQEQGMAVVFIGTGGDPGHAPARRLYASLGYRLFPAAQYYKVLSEAP